MSNAKFRVSSALKSIIGGELITDDFIAVFELVKNSFDAHAENVEVRFENLKEPTRSNNHHQDDGKGMTESDLKEKWLHVAYSAKLTKPRIQIFPQARNIAMLSDRLGHLQGRKGLADSPVIGWAVSARFYSPQSKEPSV